MSLTVTYKGTDIIDETADCVKVMKTQGKYLEDDVTIDYTGGTAPTLISKSITANGTYNASSDNADGYSSVTVNVPAISQLELLAEYEITTPTNEITFTPNFASYTDYFIILISVDNVVLSANDWLYLGLKSNGDFGYFDKGSAYTSYTSVKVPIMFFNFDNGHWISTRGLIATGKSMDNIVVDSAKLFLSTYSANVNIESGIVKVYGLKAQGV